MMNTDFLGSILVASILFLGFYQALRLKTEKTATYRLFLIFFSVRLVCHFMDAAVQADCGVVGNNL